MTPTVERRARRRWLFGNMRRALTLLIVLAIVPLLLVQVGIAALWFKSRRSLDNEKNRLVALEVLRVFQDFVHDVTRQELAAGIGMDWLKPQQPERMSRYLKSTAQELVAVRVWDLVDRAGRVTASTDASRVGRRLNVDADWYREIMAGQRGYVTDLLPDRPDDQPAFLIARRIRDERGNLQGISVVEIDAKGLGPLFADIERTEGGMLCLMDRKGILVYVAPEVELADRETIPPDPALHAALTTGETATKIFVSAIDQRQHLGTRILVPEIGWVVGASRPTEVLRAPVIRTLCSIGLVNLLVIGISLSAAGLLAGQMLRSLRSLQAHSQAVGQGDLAHRTKVTGIQELEDLAESFNLMGAKLQEARTAQEQANAALEQRVAERTAELRDANQLLEREIAERKRSEAALKEQSRILEAFYRYTISPLVFLDKELRCLRVNDAYARAMRGNVADFVGRKYAELYDKSETDEQLFQEVLRTKTRCEQFGRMYRLPGRLEGEPTYWDWSLVPVLDDQGEVDFLIFSLQEVTERKVAEDRLRESEQKLRAIFDHTFQFIGLLTPEGAVIEANRESLNATGVERSAVIGKLYWDTPGWRDNPSMQEKLQAYVRAAAEGQFVRFETSYHGGDGVPIYLDFSFTPVRDESGRVAFIIPEARDITERKRAEEELARYRARLEELVAQRTADLELATQYLEAEIAQRKQAAEGLEQAASELTRSNRELEQFAYIASHDLQEPLRVISGYLQLLQRRYQGRLDADADQFIQYAVDGAKRMQQLISDLLEYSRVGSRGREFQPTDTEDVLEETCRILQRVVADTGAVITHDSLPTVSADRTQLIQLFQNLIGNAIKFHGERRPEIHVSAAPDGERWRFSVRDNGIGIERQYWDQVFAVFHRLHTRHKYAGTGIGLAVCKKIVERHGGRVWLDSEPGQGTTFYFTI